ncbi:MAG: DUF3465 domain-containing protein [Gammaproteobacteria bacterium]
MKKLLLLVGLVIAAFIGVTREDDLSVDDAVGIDTQIEDTPANAWENRSSNVQVEGEGIVTRILADDNDGSRHQRFIIRLDTGQTLLVSHNVDLAPRIPRLREGDEVAFNGEYEWNPQGGVIHWTHDDPEGRHPAGWIKHDGATYQ